MADPDLRDVPVVAIAPQNDKAARLSALADGLDDVLAHPFKDTFLLARVRSLLRARADTQDLSAGNSSQPIGFAERRRFDHAASNPARVAVLTHSARTGTLCGRTLWRNVCGTV